MRRAAAALVLAAACGRTTTAPDAPPPAEQVAVPAGPFLMGCSGDAGPCGHDVAPAHEVRVDGFWIDQTEVTVAAHDACVRAGACARRAYHPAGIDDRPDFPATGVTWDEAVRYCAWVGKRLPHEAEWEKAARGTDGRLYPWGSEPPSCALAVATDCERASPSGLAPVGSRVRGASPYGALDMAGNAAEWVEERRDQGMRVVRGGQRAPDELATTFRGGWWPDKTRSDLGFRCARDQR